jgi:AcrR family transcriptional regulator
LTNRQPVSAGRRGMAEAKQRGGRTQAERSATTREAIVAAATRLFAERGYEATGIDEVTRAAGVSKGALYHHYSDKADVLAAVYEDVETKLVERLVAVASRETDPLEAVRAGAHAFLDACVDPVTRQIVLVDAPVGLGWERWRSIGSRYGFGLLLAGLQAAADAGQIAGDHLEERSRLLLAALIEASLLMSASDTPRKTRAAIGVALDDLIEGMRVPRLRRGSGPRRR